MGNKFHELPPLKRYKLMQEEEKHNEKLHQNQPNHVAAAPHCLPAKKRKDSRDFPPTLPDSTTTYCLPAKKRVWAIRDFDLNIEFQYPWEDAQKSQEESQETNKNQDAPDDVFEAGGGRKEEIIGIGKLKEERKENEDSEKKGGDIIVAGKLKEESENGDVDKDEDEDDGILCAICESTDGDPSDPIVFCDGCELMVHASCYGHPFTKGIPDGDWFCAQCLVSKSSKNTTINQIRKPFSCCLCPTIGGALKPTTEDGKWAHVVCALFVPEVYFSDSEGREGVDIAKVPARRWKQKCYLCKSKNGCAIDCSEPKCPLAFHVTCGLKEDLCFEYTEGRNKTDIVAGFCRTHSDLWKKQQQTGKFKIVARDESKK